MNESGYVVDEARSRGVPVAESIVVVLAGVTMSDAIVLLTGALVWSMLMIGVQFGNALTDAVNQRRK